MSYTVTVTVDTNDADYIHESVNLGDREFAKLLIIIEKIKPIWRKQPRIEDYDDKEFREHYATVLDEGELELFMELIPIPEPGYAELEDISYVKGSPTDLLDRYMK